MSLVEPQVRKRAPRRGEGRQVLSLAQRIQPGEMPWASLGHCHNTDPATFYPDPALRGIKRDMAVAEAKAVCAGLEQGERCPVLSECLVHALTTPEQFGIWAGTTEDERRVMLRRRKAV